MAKITYNCLKGVVLIDKGIYCNNSIEIDEAGSEYVIPSIRVSKNKNKTKGENKNVKK